MDQTLPIRFLRSSVSYVFSEILFDIESHLPEDLSGLFHGFDRIVSTFYDQSAPSIRLIERSL